jgi:uncharacterized protein (TIGR03790 family)
VNFFPRILFVPITALSLLLVGCGKNDAQGQSTPNSSYAKSTLVIYNSNVEDSRNLAVYYTTQRGLDKDHVIGLDCPDKETITRAEYLETVEKPLKAQFEKNGWWKTGTKDGVAVAVENKIQIIALMYGMPMRIAPTPPEPTGKVDPATGKPIPPAPDFQNSDAASVDSELSAMGILDHEAKSLMRNFYYNQNRPFHETGLPMMMLVGRIDGPSFDTAKRLITDAVEVEKGGLWGSAYVDLARLETVKGEGYKEGDDRLRRVIAMYKRFGIPCTVDQYTERFPPNYPMGDNVALYFGWYVYHADGPFKDGDFRFKKGAVASHLHSYSATTVKAQTHWVAPLLERGAAAVLGTVYEPFLTYYTQFDIFNARLLSGFTFIEAAWMATPATSWMNVMIGDPLYQPFSVTAQVTNQPDADYKAYKLGSMRWSGESEVADLEMNLARAGDKLKSGNIYEGIANRMIDELRYVDAAPILEKAKDLYEKDEDKLRVEMHAVNIFRLAGKKPLAIEALKKIVDKYKAIPEHKAAVAWLNFLDPPPPPPPPAAPKSN